MLTKLSKEDTTNPDNKQDCKWFCSKKNRSFTREDIFSVIDLVIDHSYFKFGDKVFSQYIGIPWGIDPAPQMAKLYLFYSEAKFMEMFIKENYSAANKFNYIRGPSQ